MVNKITRVIPIGLAIAGEIEGGQYKMLGMQMHSFTLQSVAHLNFCSAPLYITLQLTIVLTSANAKSNNRKLSHDKVVLCA